MATAVTMAGPSVSQRKVFVGGLSWETDEQSLRDYFAQYGSVSDCVIMRDRMTGHPRGFGFVTYDDQIVAERVAAEFHELDGRQVEAKIAVPRSECVPAVRTSAWRATKKVFVGGLPATCRETELHAHFIRYGDIAECQVMYDHQTGNSRGFGFVTFTAEATVDRVVDIEIHEIMAKQVEVKRAEPKQALEQRRGREAAAAAAALSHSFGAVHAVPPTLSPTKSATAGGTASALAMAAAAAMASKLSAQPRLSSAPSLSFAAAPQAAWPGSVAAVPSPPPLLPFHAEDTASGGGGGVQQQQQQQQQQRSFALAGGMGFFTPGQAYSADLAQCAYNALYATGAPGDAEGAAEVSGGLASARLERRFHPYSSRERVERSYR